MYTDGIKRDTTPLTSSFTKSFRKKNSNSAPSTRREDDPDPPIEN